MSQERIRVKITVGKANVEIEAPPDLLEKSIKDVMAALGVSETLEPESEPQKRTRSAETSTCRGLVENMLKEGWFSTPRPLSEVVAELARRGHHYDPTAVAHVLLDMVREGVLVRIGRPRRYLYSAQPASTAKVETEESESNNE
ncbi:MAG: hypothetical protein LZ158_05845 [Thaumarchaeota archaeon]|jgi:hypothetical protein|nr:hypothetical protein [Candidatus Terraquivivens yellowstonensis]MCL7387535.1 hypothetical protein [Candidatus Terraquivivens yellowstonensis]MCL7393093.1 hypothetical protein [Candidatus Terraquivivens yellowstonensis]MCL7395359.1 hypothetical protein [Candidatus Terraquivivens yellowstonensis]MCL7398284.1 hypothetical protein [Candidatus Terraquivivens yellowstonensis]